jgi:hypothetical protein
VHHHAGYLRVQADVLRGADGAARELLQSLVERTPGHRRSAHNPQTGTFVVEYEPGALDADELLERMADALALGGVEHAIRRAMNRRELVGTFLDAVQGVNRIARELSASGADLRELVPAALWATAVVSFILDEDRARLPRWDSALYRGYRIFMQWHLREVSAHARKGLARDAEAGDEI